MVTSDAISPSYCEQQEYTNACQQTVEDSKRVIAGFKNSGIEAYRHTLQQADVEAHLVPLNRLFESKSRGIRCEERVVQVEVCSRFARPVSCLQSR